MNDTYEESNEISLGADHVDRGEPRPKRRFTRVKDSGPMAKHPHCQQCQSTNVKKIGSSLHCTGDQPDGTPARIIDKDRYSCEDCGHIWLKVTKYRTVGEYTARNPVPPEERL